MERNKLLHILFLTILANISCSLHAERLDTLPATPADSIQTHSENQTDTLNWLYLIRHRSLNLQDTAVHYPRFIRFCVNVYNWADKTFNSYDPQYVEGTGKRWKARFASDNWLDDYALTFPKKMTMRMMSDLYLNAGLNLQYMAVGIGHSINIGHTLSGKPINQKRTELGFNCARFNIDLSYTENTGGTFIRRFNLYDDNRFIKRFFPGISLHTLTVDGYYFFNNRRYSQGAAYNFSKIQKQSQGSFMAGISYTNQDLSLDFSTLDLDLLSKYNLNEYFFKFHYNAYSLIFGYGYNWVCNKHLLYNITVMPGVGFLHAYEDSADESGKMLSLGARGKMSLTYNLHNFFLCFIGRFNGHWYYSDRYSLFSSIENFSLNAGIRF